jgi:hypothetical protein
MAYYRAIKQTTTATVRINITALRHQGYFKPGIQANGSIMYSQCGVILTRLYIETKDSNKVTFKYTWNGEEVIQEIGIGKRPSNLSRGDLYFFVCPYTHKYVRNLYLPIGAKRFASNYAFTIPLYYESQTHTKYYKAVGQCLHLEKQIEKIENARNQTHYNGQLTKRSKRINALYAKYAQASEKSLQDLINLNILGNE